MLRSGVNRQQFWSSTALWMVLALVLDLMNVLFGWKGISHPQVILPILVLALGPLPTIVRQTRAGMLEVMGEDYIRFC